MMHAAILEALPTAGDFDNDIDVDGQDFLAWQRDPNIGDLADWASNYGLLADSAATTIPEPSVLALASGLWLLLVNFRCSRYR